MKSKLFQITLIFALSILFSCISSKHTQRVDSPDDYYEQEVTSTESTVKEQDKNTTKADNKSTAIETTKNTPQQPKPSTSASTSTPSVSTSKTENKSQKAENNKNNTPPTVESQSTTIKFEESPISPEVQEEMGDDGWAKDESKLKIKKKDKEKIKDSSPDDDKWGKE